LSVLALIFVPHIFSHKRKSFNPLRTMKDVRAVFNSKKAVNISNIGIEKAE